MFIMFLLMEVPYCIKELVLNMCTRCLYIFMGSYSQTMGAHIHRELLPDNGCTYSWEVTPQTMGAHIHGK